MQNNSKNLNYTKLNEQLPHPEQDNIPEDFLLSSYSFELPEELIAQYPCKERGDSKLYVLPNRLMDNSLPGKITDFKNILEQLPPNCLFVANNSRVLPARLQGTRPSGGKFEFLLLTPLPLAEAESEFTADNWQQCQVKCLLRPSKKFKEGETYTFGITANLALNTTCSDNDVSEHTTKATTNENLRFTVIKKEQFGQCSVLLQWRGSLLEQVLRCGHIPLPPYIRREADSLDEQRYQTVFSKMDKCGSVAAPTAGLHFTEDIRAKMQKAGHDWAEVTLFVGYGTFSPVREDDIRKHSMHAEYVEITQKTVDKILQAKAEKRPVIAVGTTSTRVLEGMAEQLAQKGSKNLLEAWQGWLNCFIYPGRELRVIDGLLTNFHLPESSLLMLVSALCGRERLLAAYKQAIAAKLRFFSYGDAMLIL